MGNELKPCPFCGCEEIEIRVKQYLTGDWYSCAVCTRCSHSGPTVARVTADKAKYAAVAPWNEQGEEKAHTPWIANNWPPWAAGLLLAAVVLVSAFAIGYNSASPKGGTISIPTTLTPIAAPTPLATIVATAPATVPYLGMAGGDWPVAPPPIPTPGAYSFLPPAGALAPAPGAVGAVATEVPDYRYPTWWAMTDAQRRLSLSTAYTKLDGGGGKLLGLDALETSRLFAVAQTWNFGHAETNPYDVCASGGCWTCQAFKGAVVCEDPGRKIAVIEWDSGPLFGGKLTPVPAPTLGVPVVPTKAK
jgi:hypothetical protein